MKSPSTGVFLPTLLGILLAGWLPMESNAAPIDEFRISALEQQIRDLQDTVREQSRQIAEMKMGRPGAAATQASSTQVGSGKNPPANSSLASSPLWLSAAKWQQLKPGMSELQVVELLGAPNQLRSEDGRTRQLMYALEIGRSGFLSGKVTTQDNKVTVIEPPVLR